MGDGTPYKPLSEIGTLVKPTSAPPEPPTRPFSGPVFEEKTGNYHCKVPGCTKASKAFKGRHAMAIHVIRRHGMTLEGKVHRLPDRARPAAIEPEREFRLVSVRGILGGGTNQALVEQTVKAIQAAKENLSGKLAEMETLRLKAAKLDAITACLKELLPDQPAAPQA